MIRGNGHAEGPLNGGHKSEIEPYQNFKLVRWNDITLNTRRQYVIRGLLPREGLCLLWGPPGCGKSFMAYDMAMHIALGWKYRNRRTAKGTVVYVAFEGEPGLPQRGIAFGQKYLQDATDPLDFWLVMTKLKLPPNSSYIVDAIRSQLGAAMPSVIFIDTLNRSYVGSENKDDDMAAYIEAADLVYSAFNCCVVIIHHSGVAGDRYRGHTSLKGAADAEIQVAKSETGLITATVIKMKDGQDGVTLQSKLEVIEIGTDEDGENITSCVVIAADEVVPKDDEPLTKRERDTLKALEDTLSFASQPAPNGHAALRAVAVETWRKQAYLCKAIDETKSGHRARWSEVRESLIAKRKIFIEDNLVWVNA